MELVAFDKDPGTTEPIPRGRDFKVKFEYTFFEPDAGGEIQLTCPIPGYTVSPASIPVPLPSQAVGTLSKEATISLQGPGPGAVWVEARMDGAALSILISVT